ncbi:MAG TPA: helix-turn-helix transcriptional regulator [Jatrophihabitans sp.]|jgi:transcriptional regulator with XRE-family HTH domain|nr:helix-turn-helix transcriptional regulator [Jatrophihabitans sp.]
MTTTTAPVEHSSETLRRQELGEFLRSRRERIAPEQVGVTYNGRRRTPGLRREEVAQLSAVGVTWYTWLEQGRDIHVSEQVLTAIARTLMLDRDERAHLFTLAGATDQSVAKECAAVSPQLHTLLAKLDPFPACVISGKYDVLAYNRGYNNLLTNFDELPIDDRNCMWLSFTDPLWKKVVVDWEDMAARMVANLRVLMADHVGDSTWKSFIARLRAASPEFADMWARHEVRGIENKTKRFRHPVVGLLKFDVTNTWLAPSSGRRMLVYTPSDAETARRADRLVELN